MSYALIHKFKPERFDVGDEVLILRRFGGRQSANVGSKAVILTVYDRGGKGLGEDASLYVYYKARLLTGKNRGRIVRFGPGRAFKIPVREEVLEHYLNPKKFDFEKPYELTWEDHWRFIATEAARGRKYNYQKEYKEALREHETKQAEEDAKYKALREEFGVKEK